MHTGVGVRVVCVVPSPEIPRALWERRAAAKDHEGWDLNNSANLGEC